jgi:shikimate kinase
MEKRMLKRVAAKHGQVVALGGGALLDEESRKLAEATGRIVFIDCPEAELIRRVSRSCDRPLLASGAEKKLKELLGRRSSHYASFSERINIA